MTVGTKAGYYSLWRNLFSLAKVFKTHILCWGELERHVEKNFVKGLAMHIILENAKRYDLPVSVETPEGFEYDKTIGLWRDISTGEPYITSSEVRRPATKKHDVETGEDQKGE